MIIKLPIGLVMRISDLLGMIAKMEPGFEVYEKARELTRDLYDEVKGQLPPP